MGLTWLLSVDAMITFSSPKDWLRVMWESETRSEYMDLIPLLVAVIIPEPTDAIEVSLPSESYLLQKDTITRQF